MILHGDCFEMLATLPSGSAQMCVTSPPYWGLRDYGVGGQLGLEESPEEYVNKLRLIFEQVRRVLKDDGTLWLNLGDSYSGSGKGAYADGIVRLTDKSKKQNTSVGTSQGIFKKTTSGLKDKDLVGIPWRVAFALQADGWYLRQDIIWHKPNPMPESVRDRCTKAHEYMFLLSKRPTYYFDVDAIKEPSVSVTGSGNKVRKARPGQESLGIGAQAGSIPWTPRLGKIIGRGEQGYSAARGNDRDNSGGFPNPQGTRQKRSVWTVTPKPFKGAHFATFPPDLIEPCILAGSKVGDTVLDPFFGAGTTGLVANKHARKYIGIELNPEYVAMAQKRIDGAT